MPFFSIIVPIYNAEATLTRCLRSIQTQREGDFEVLPVENGSQDASGEICRAFSAQDARFRLLSLPCPCGPSNARNAGLDSARGEWLIFVDADDFLAPDLLQKVRKEAENGADSVFFGYHRCDKTGNVTSSVVPRVSGALFPNLSAQDCFGYTWCKAFRRECVGKMRFMTDLDLFEDEIFACEVLANCRKIAVLGEPLYYYLAGGALTSKTHADFPSKCDRVYHAWCALVGQARAKFRAKSLAENCKFYLFERNIDMGAFVEALSKTAFLRAIGAETAFSRAVFGKKVAYLRLWRAAYRAKVHVSKLLGRCAK